MLLLTASYAGFACEIEMKIADGNNKDVYSPGDIIIIELTIVNTHRDCHEQIEKAQIMADGCKVMAATPWKELKTGTYFRKLKVVILPDGGNNLQLVCKRSCDKDGGFGKLILPKKS